MSDSAAESPRWQRRPEARPEEILDAAAVEFGEHGFAGTRLEEVARRAGVSKGTLYLYFDSKEALFREMVRAKVVALVVEGEELLHRDVASERERLELYVRRAWDIMRRPEMTRIAQILHAEHAKFPELGKFYFDEVMLRGRRLLQAILERGVARGEFRPVAHDFGTRAIPFLLSKAAQVQCAFAVYDPDALSDEQALEGIIDLVLNGILARPPASSEV